MNRYVKIFSVLLIVEFVTTGIVGVLFYKYSVDLTVFLNKLSVLFVFLFILSIVASYVIMKREEEIYLSIEALINDVRKGRLNIPETDDIVLYRLYSAIKRIFNILMKQQGLIEQERERLRYLINSLNEGLLLVDENGEIELINPAAMKLFNIKEDKGNIFDLCNDFRLINAVKDLLGSSKSLTLDIDGKTYMFKKQDLAGKVLILITDISEQERYQRMKTEFFEEASHELKTPITSIMGFSETLLDSENMDNATRNKFLQYIYDSAKHLTELIEDILMLSRLEKREVSKEGTCDLRELKDVLLASFEGECKRKNLDFIVSCDTGVVNIPCGHVKSVVWNLVDNAIKFTGKGYVKLVCSISGNYFVVDVEDTGIGIDKKDKERIFERFYTSQISKNTRLSGTGLGLAIVKHIAKLYNGSVEVFSEQGKGSQFIVKLEIPK